MRIYFEGDWTRYYDYLQDLPKGHILGAFEYMDPQLAKDKLGKTMCITAGYDVSLLQYGTKKSLMKPKLMDVLGRAEVIYLPLPKVLPIQMTEHLKM